MGSNGHNSPCNQIFVTEVICFGMSAAYCITLVCLQHTVLRFTCLTSPPHTDMTPATGTKLDHSNQDAYSVLNAHIPMHNCQCCSNSVSVLW